MTGDRRAPLVVAIDGPVGVGKSSVAQRVAQRLGVPWLETGAMYRAVALAVRERGIDPDSSPAVEALAAELDLGLFVGADGRVEVRLEGRDVAARLRKGWVSDLTSRIATLPGVRSRMVELQRRFALETGGVLEGRDIGTRVVPETPHKFFLDAPVEVRAERRRQQLRERGRGDASAAEVLEAVRRRDHRDTHRAESPLGFDESYEVVDTARFSLDEVVERIVGRVREAAGH